MDRMGGVESPLARGAWDGICERPPHQPFPVLFDRLVFGLKSGHFIPTLAKVCFYLLPPKKIRKMRNDQAAAETAPIR